MGFGLPEYLHLFRKPQTDRSRGYADVPVVKDKRLYDKKAEAWSNDGYSRARWQLDAAGFARSSGDRLLTPSELARLDPKGIYRAFKAHSLNQVYDFEHHVACGEALDEVGKLPPDFGIIPAHSYHPDVWTDVARMQSLNTIQAARGREKHLCPLPFDIVNRAIAQLSMPGELVLDPFGGLGTVAFCAIKQKRRGYSIELNADYHRDAVRHCQDAECQASTPTLFDLLKVEEKEVAA